MFNGNYPSILHRFRGIANYLLKFANFSLPQLHLLLPLGLTPFKFNKDRGNQRTTVPGLSCGIVCVILHLAILVELRLVTDTQHRQTQSHSIILCDQSWCGKSKW